MDDERIDIKKLTTDEFISKAKSTHGDRYDYSKTIYDTAIKKVVIICRKHGEFIQTPNNHLNGQGCIVCGGTCRLDTNSFINKAMEVHGGLYDYSFVEYINMKTKVIVGCKVHGEFVITPDSHLRGGGCRKCADRLLSINRTMSLDEFVSRATSIFKGYYKYSKTEYKGAFDKVIITCIRHGDFEQIANDHLSGHGCNICLQSSWCYKDLPTLLYYIVIGIGANTKYKVGITTKSVQERFATEIRKGYTIKVISTRMFDTGKPAFMLEQLVLRAVKYKRHTEAKFLVKGVGDSELFNHPLTDEELKIFNDEGN